MQRSFNTAGPCNPAVDYMLPAMERLPEVMPLIERGKYFVVHAPRQTGKTTALLTLARELVEGGRYNALLASVERADVFAGIEEAERAILDAIREAASRRLPPVLPELQPPPWPEASTGGRIASGLSAWARSSPRPLVLFLDEVDALQDEPLLSLLRQLREGYADRPAQFPASLALIGMRDLEDYRIRLEGRDRLRSPSPFNIVTRSLMLRTFTRGEVAALYAQHTAETGQAFGAEAVDRAFALTGGQPWLVNALAAALTEELVTDRGTAIGAAAVERAGEVLVERQQTHLRSLAERLREARVRAVIEPMLAGGTPEALSPDDVRYVCDLGLMRLGSSGGLEVANPLYREILVRELAVPTRAALPSIQPTWMGADGRLDPERLLEAFLAFWRQHGEPLLGTAAYHEIAPHLVLMAFLHRVVNGGGRVEREYAIGRGRMDLCVRHGGVTVAMELKVWRDGRADPVEEGLEQLDGYLAGLGLDEGWLVIFDQRSGQAPIAERTRVERRVTGGGRRAVVVRG